jgi:modification methylase
MAITSKVIFGNCIDMNELSDNSVHLTVTSPPYFNAPFDYPDLYKTYESYLSMLSKLSVELYRVTAEGRIAAFVVDDMLVNGDKFPVVADLTKIMMNAGFRYRDRIVWIKPKGYTRISRRSGVLVQHPYPMYFYPDNIQESIVLLQKGKFDFSYMKKLPRQIVEQSKIDVKEINNKGTYMTVWENGQYEGDAWRITNVLPTKGRTEEGIAAFPPEIPKLLIKLFTFVKENVLDPFAGSGTTLQVAKLLNRNSFGYELDLELYNTIKSKLEQNSLFDDSKIELIRRRDAMNLRTGLQDKVKSQPSVTKA